MRVQTMWIAITSFAVLAVLAWISIPQASAETCRTGEEPITPQTRPLAALNGVPANVNCWRPKDPTTGQAVGEARQFLQQHATKKVNVGCFNPEFAERLQNLLQAVPGGSIPTVTDGYRSPEEQARLPKGSTTVGPCGSYHQYGLAADFNETDEKTLQWMRVNASRFGLSPVTNANPVTGCTRSSHPFCDSGHIQMQGALPPRNQCGQCSGGTGYGSLEAAPGGGGSPISSFTNAIRQWLNPQPEQLQQQPVSQQPLSQSPLDSFQTASSSNTTINNNVNVNENTNSVADTLEELAFGSGTATSTAATSSVPLVVSGSDAVGISSNQNQPGNQQTSDSGISSPSQQTFISGDLSWQDGSNAGPPLTGWSAMLATIKATLNRILQLLQPFGGEEYIGRGLE